MKIRTGFVSNSSSSSYVCDICHESEEGWDLTLRAAEMFECKSGHVVHIECSMQREAFNEFMESDEGGDYYYVPHRLCPICSLTNIRPEEEVAYLRKILGKTEEEVHSEMQKQFASNQDLYKWVNQ